MTVGLMLCSCQKNDTDPNENWAPGDYWIDTRDGQSYATVKIGGQVWMAENFNFLPDSGSWVYNKDPLLTSTYGRLYTWESAVKVCPAEWHLPLQEEWLELVEHLGGADVAGGKLKESGTAHWESPNEGATNAVGFSALPGGYMWFRDKFQDLNEYAHFWSSSKYSHEYANTIILSWLGPYVNTYNTLYLVGTACSVRYIKDQY